MVQMKISGQMSSYRMEIVGRIWIWSTKTIICPGHFRIQWIVMGTRPVGIIFQVSTCRCMYGMGHIIAVWTLTLEALTQMTIMSVIFRIYCLAFQLMFGDGFNGKLYGYLMKSLRNHMVSTDYSIVL